MIETTPNPERDPFVWHRRAFITVIAVAGILVVGNLLRSRESHSQVAPPPPPPKPVKKEEKPQPLVFSVPARFQATTVYDAKLTSQEKVIALTFDDGPWPENTAYVLDLLKKNGIKATFFWVGEHLQNFKEIASKVVADGHAIGNHTWSHRYRRFSEAAAANEIDNLSALIYKITGVKTHLFRPPGGFLGNGLAAYAKKKKNVVVMWSVSSADTVRGVSAQRIINNVLAQSQNGGIVLLHDGGGPRKATMKALPNIIAGLKKKGFKFVTVPELLEMHDKELKLAAAAKSASPVVVPPRSPIKETKSQKP